MILSEMKNFKSVPSMEQVYITFILNPFNIKGIIFSCVENCKITVENDFKFKFGRKDCVQSSFDTSEELLTPWPWESARHENHANAYGTGKKVVQDLEVKSLQ